MNIGQLTALATGSVLNFDIPSHATATLSINGSDFASGPVVRSGEFYAV